MNKLKLNLDELKVETFQSASASEQCGTVQAREFFGSFANTCNDTNCGASFCISSPCAC